MASADVPKKSAIKSKLELFFAKLRPSRKDLVERNILEHVEGDQQSYMEERKQRRSGIVRLLSKRSYSKRNVAATVGGGTGGKHRGQRGLARDNTIDVPRSDEGNKKSSRKMDKRSQSLTVQSTTRASSSFKQLPVGPQALSSPAICVHMSQESTLQFSKLALPPPQLNLSLLTPVLKADPLTETNTDVKTDDLPKSADQDAKTDHWQEASTKSPHSRIADVKFATSPRLASSKLPSLTPKMGTVGFGASPWLSSAYKARIAEIEPNQTSILQDHFKQNSKLSLSRTKPTTSAGHVFVDKEYSGATPACHATPFFDSLMDQMEL